jgi:hypothetical protein
MSQVDFERKDSKTKKKTKKKKRKFYLYIRKQTWGLLTNISARDYNVYFILSPHELELVFIYIAYTQRVVLNADGFEFLN